MLVSQATLKELLQSCDLYEDLARLQFSDVVGECGAVIYPH